MDWALCKSPRATLLTESSGWSPREGSRLTYSALVADTLNSELSGLTCMVTLHFSFSPPRDQISSTLRQADKQAVASRKMVTTFSLYWVAKQSTLWDRPGSHRGIVALAQSHTDRSDQRRGPAQKVS